MRALHRLLLCVTTVGGVASGASAEPVAHVVSTTRSAVHVDVGSNAGLVVGATWQIDIGGQQRTVTVESVARTQARLAVDGAPLLAPGAVIPLPATLTPPPASPGRRDEPAPLETWREDRAGDALASIRVVASAAQPTEPNDDTLHLRGELSLSMFAGADLGNSSTSWQDLSLASQLNVTSGSWRYDHLIDARLAGSPELFMAPLQHARAMLNIYLMRLQWTSASGAFVAALGRQPAAPIGQLGMVDGARVRVAVGRGVDVSAFAGMRAATDLGLTSAPRVGADLGWNLVGPVRARADVAVALDTWDGVLDRASTAAAVVVATPRYVVAGDALLDLANDAAGLGGPRVSHAIVRVRSRSTRLRLAGSGGYDQPYLSRAYIDAGLIDAMGSRVFGELSANVGVGDRFDIGGSARLATGDGFTSAYGDCTVTRLPITDGLRLSAAPHVVIGDLVQSYGLRGDASFPLRSWRLGAGGSFDRVLADGGEGWLGVGRVTTSRPLSDRLRMSLALEGAGGAGTPRALLFAQLSYRVGD